MKTEKIKKNKIIQSEHNMQIKNIIIRTETKKHQT